jgi:hypothetical protein
MVSAGGVALLSGESLVLWAVNLLVVCTGVMVLGLV